MLGDFEIGQKLWKGMLEYFDIGQKLW